MTQDKHNMTPLHIHHYCSNLNNCISNKTSASLVPKGFFGMVQLSILIELMQYHSPNHRMYVSSLVPVMLSPLSITSHFLMRRCADDLIMWWDACAWPGLMPQSLHLQGSNKLSHKNTVIQSKRLTIRVIKPSVSKTTKAHCKSGSPGKSPRHDSSVLFRTYIFVIINQYFLFHAGTTSQFIHFLTFWIVSGEIVSGKNG
jgi:hypothetical protein